MTTAQSFFASVPRGMESLLADELATLGAGEIRQQSSGVDFTGTLETAYRVCLWSRLANRVLMPIASFDAKTEELLYDGIMAIDWAQHMRYDDTFAIDAVSARSRVSHTKYIALKAKDAIVDQFRATCGGERPSVDLLRASLRLNIYILRNRATLSIDLSGDSLHRRSYRLEGGAAPLKENLAAAILTLAGWPELAKNGAPLIDPMCGSGTLLIEAALMAADIAPGLLRSYFGFRGWRGHDPMIWSQLRQEAEQRRSAGLEQLPPIYGYDQSGQTISMAQENIARAELDEYIVVSRRALQELQPPGSQPGLLVVNPPYAERLGEEAEVIALYKSLGVTIKQRLPGWRAAVFTGNPKLIPQLGLRWFDSHELNNGALPCKLFNFQLGAQDDNELPTDISSPGAQMLTNRLRKNLSHLGKWARRNQVSCYRLYDADLPEYAVAIDLYQGEQLWVHMQEYQAPRSIDPLLAQLRLNEARAVVAAVLGIPSEQIFLKVRQRQKGKAQYEKLAATQQFYQVQDGQARCLVNFTDYLDTGLFLDHRITRQMLHDLAGGKRFLNLFAYTGVATVHAALGGAARTTTVDMSATYLDWARRNMALNGFKDKDGTHQFIQADCIQWLTEQAGNPHAPHYELIFLDPPTFSSSKRMDDTFDVQRDHAHIIRNTTRLLAPGGLLIFSNNNQRFKLDLVSLADLHIEDISHATLPEDYKRNPRIHQCWIISKKPG